MGKKKQRKEITRLSKYPNATTDPRLGCFKCKKYDVPLWTTNITQETFYGVPITIATFYSCVQCALPSDAILTVAVEYEPKSTKSL
jgi:hypothetical protein